MGVSKIRQWLLTLLLAVGMLSSSVSRAEKRGEPEGRISGSIKVDSVKTPDFKDSKQPTKYHWCRITVNYDIPETGSSSKFTNGLEIIWRVAVLDKDKKTVVLAQDIEYEDVEEGSGHHACVYIKPAFFKRFRGNYRFSSSDFSIYVELRLNGEKLDSREEGRLQLPKNWYKNIDGKIERSDRYLLPRSKTPFAPLDYDYYETEKAFSENER